MSIEKKLSAMRTAFLADEAERYDSSLRLTDSPVEKMMVAALFARGWQHAQRLDGSMWRALRDSTPAMRAAQAADLRRAHITPSMFLERGGDDDQEAITTQCRVLLDGALYRIDLAYFWVGARIAVELDGHDFHEKTKEQARVEKSRQRLLTADGWHVVRFTGSEVYANPDRCCAELESIGEKLMCGSPASRRP